jgi:phage FluMu protein Com
MKDAVFERQNRNAVKRHGKQHHIVRCPRCKKLIAVIFPIHECTPIKPKPRRKK